MVDRKNIDLTMSTIAVLIIPKPQQEPIDQKELEQILTRPLTIGQSPMGLLVSSQRKQLEVIAGGNKINVKDLSGRQEFHLSSIPPVLDFFIKKSASKLTSYGVNFIFTLPCHEPKLWIRDNLFTHKISEKSGKTLIGGTATLQIASEPKTWNIKFEPSDEQIMNLDFNASEEIEQIPDQNKLRVELQEQFDALLSFLNGLGL